MKIIETWTDTRYNAVNTLYELPNGTRLLHSKDPKTIDTKISVLTNAGANFEHLTDVPDGTAHFLEHILAGDTNKYFKSKAATDNFEYGNKKRPSVSPNASTSRTAVALYSSTNSTHEERAGKRVLSMIDFPIELAEKKIEKERKIIIAERNESPKKELSPHLHLLNLLFQDNKPEYVRYIDGEIEDIKAVTVEDLAKYHRKYFTRDNLIISVQSSRDISGKLLKHINSMDEAIFEKNGDIELPVEVFKNTYRYDHYQEPKAQGIYVDLSYFKKSEKKNDYFEMASESLVYKLLGKLIFDIMREEKGLIYSSGRTSSGDYSFNYDIKGLSFNCDPKDLVKSLDELHNIMFKKAEKFVETKAGQRWFDSEISRLIFPPTVTFNDSYAEGKAHGILTGYEIWNHERAIEAAMKITPSNLIEFLKKNILTQKFHVWLYSSLEKEEVYKMYEKSEIHKLLRV